MKNLKKILCMLLAIAMVFSMAACGNSGNESTAGLLVDGEWDVNADSDSSDANTNQGATPGNQGATPGNQTTSSNNGGTSANNGGATTNNNGSSTTNNGGSTNSSNGATTNNQAVQSPAVKNADSLTWNELVAQMPSNLRGTTINVFSWNPAKDVTGAEKVISDFEKKTGIKVQWTQGSYENYDSEIAAKINSGNSPDVIRYTTPNIARMSLTQDVKSATGYDFKGSIWDSALTSAYTIKNKIYGVNLKNTFNQQPVVVMYNKATIDRYKLDDPYDLWKDGKWDVDTFIDLCKEFTDETQRPAWMTSTQLDLLGFNNAKMITFDGKQFKNNLSDKRLVDALRKCTHYRSDGIVSEAMRSHDLIENGTYLFFTDAIIGARRTDFHYSNIKAEENLYCVPVPEGFSDKYYQSYYEYEAYGIPKGAKNAPAVYYYLRYYLDANNYDRNMFFCNTQALETYEWCRKQKNVYYNIDSFLTKMVGSENAGLDGYLRVSGQEAQLQNEIDKVANPIVNNAVKQANKTLEKFK